ncbi:Cytoplasmic polyadenylation element-binding protein 1-B [Armadillidium vulgare]|nr:Cytoplasmic polyadenylation element-binding protein 1-B [Armadillidium vulgare]
MSALSLFEKDSVWNDIVKPSSNDECIKQRSVSEGGNLPLSRLLAQTYSYSSDSTSPSNSRYSPPQVSNRSIFSYSDDSPQSNGSNSSRQSFSYSSSSSGAGSFPSRSFRLSSVGDPGPPTLDDVILMGSLPDNSSTNPKDLSLSDLMVTNILESSLSVGNSDYSSTKFNSNLNSSSLLPKLGAGSSNHNHNNCNSLGLSSGLGGLTRSSSFPSSCGSDLSSNQNSSQGMDLNQLQNMWLASQYLPNLMDSPNLFGGIGGLRTSTSPNSHLSSPLSSLFPGSDPYAIEKQAKMHRSAAAAVCDATCTWSGNLPKKVNKNPFYSYKVFLGGVPWDVTELALRQAFLQFGTIQVEWPGKENSANPPKGYVYILFENEKQVKALLAACTQDINSENYYFKISSRRMRQKEVQVIPWVIGDSNYVQCPSHQLDPAKTVFVGALHGMLSAEALATIMNDLFGGVVYSGIDTDKHKYPIGSGRVTFNNAQSYKKAVRAAFIEIKTSKFTKKVQIDPYLADSPCQLCGSQQGPYFCRDENCFRYYCRSCWQLTHSGCGVNAHKPLMRDPKLRTQPVLNRIL